MYCSALHVILHCTLKLHGIPQFSKIIEKIFNTLDSFIEKYNILSGNQYGFRTKHSPSLALIELLENLSTSIDSKNITVGVFIGLKKAFDTIDHSLLEYWNSME